MTNLPCNYTRLSLKCWRWSRIVR